MCKHEKCKEIIMERLTKQDLLDIGVTDVTEDGKVYVNGELRKLSVTSKATKYGGIKHYVIVVIPDRKAAKRDTVQRVQTKKHGLRAYKRWCYRTKTIPLGRLMLAWFTGSIEADEDCDHIDNNTFNNHIDNLQKLTRKENLAKRFVDSLDEDSWKAINKKYYELIYKKPIDNNK